MAGLAQPLSIPTPGLDISKTLTPELGDSTVAGNLTSLTSKDSALNQMARTEGLKAANRRGLMNSSMAIGAAQDAVLRNALPVAQQDASQEFNKAQSFRNAQYGLLEQDVALEAAREAQKAAQTFQTSERIGTQAWQTSERLSGQDFQTAERMGGQAFQQAQAELDRDLEKFLQDQNLSWQSGENELNRALQTYMQERGFEFEGAQNELDRALTTFLQKDQQAWQSGEAELDRQYGASQAEMNRELERYLQATDLEFRANEGIAERALARFLQDDQQEFVGGEAALDRAVQEKIARWNLSSSDRNAASQLLSNFNTQYQQEYNSIMSNTSLSAKQRSTFLSAAKEALRARINLAEQMYNVDVEW